MTKTFTQDDLIRYIYDEMPPEEAVELQQAMLCDGALQEEYKALRATVSLLDELLPQSAASSRQGSSSKA